MVFKVKTISKKLEKRDDIKYGKWRLMKAANAKRKPKNPKSKKIGGTEEGKEKNDNEKEKERST